ncbi:c-type cytochrome [Pseudorhodoplanes sinuspersici]|nr:c-type cytochrome [Pseudorhodoplanes sinuspersici]RKE65959.1 cytochrome c [Pseudorhodoplanes sinuspersici]
MTMVLLLGGADAEADMMDTTGVEPWEVCGGCHGLDGAGNRIKFPRLAGQKPGYIVKQLNDFRAGKRRNDGGQMQKMMTELEDSDLKRIAEWFAGQTPEWPGLTIEAEADMNRMRRLATRGVNDIPACLSCHSAISPEMVDRPITAPRIAGQHDFYIAKQLADFREGRRINDADGMMQRIAKKLSDADIAGLAMFLSQNPDLHEAAP